MKKLPKRRRIVSICGPSGAGKSFLVKKFTNSAQISTDDFYIGKSQMEPDENGEYNFDSPQAVQLNLCADAVKSLATLEPGNSIKIPDYDMSRSEPVGMKTVIVPDVQAIIVVEGIFSFHPPLLELSDFRIFLEPPPEVVLARRFRRDLNDRRRTPESILAQYPMVLRGYEEYIKPGRNFADIIIDFGILV